MGLGDRDRAGGCGGCQSEVLLVGDAYMSLQGMVRGPLGTQRCRPCALCCVVGTGAVFLSDFITV